MPILKVARLGHPVIRKPTDPLTTHEIQSPEIQRLIDDMIETMHEYSGVGLAAPQVHVSKQIAVIEVTHNSRYPDAPKVPLTILINPRITSRSKDILESWEGCLSIPDLRGIVPRHASITCEALDRKGKPVKLEVKGFFARVIQHEWDHLQGSVYLDRVNNLRSLSHLSEFSQFWLPSKEKEE